MTTMLNQILLGDCYELMKGIPDGSVDLVLTDPPYNVSKPNASGKSTLRNPGKNAQTFDFGEWDKDFDPAPICKEMVRVLKPDGQMYIFGGSEIIYQWISLLKDEFKFRILVWTKPDPLPQMRQRFWVSANEFVLWLSRGSYTFNFLGHTQMYSWQQYQAPKTNRLHPTQKPLPLITKLISVSSSVGETILDPFAGSGTTALAAHATGRNFICFEKEPKYHEIANKRLALAQMQGRFEEMVG